MKRSIIILGVFVLAACGAFRPGETAGEHFTVALWNVQNLFDSQESESKYPQFLAEAGWTEEKYQARLTAISQVITQMAVMPLLQPGLPDLIGFVEVENTGVLIDLAQGGLSKNGFYWTAFTNIPGSAIGIGFISRFPITEMRAHSITIGGETAPRPVLEIRIEPLGAPLVFLLCHWKSKLGGEDATEALRRASARVVQRRLRELEEAEPETPVIVMGDLNENHDAFYRRGSSMLLSLLPDDPDAAALADPAPMEYLVLSAERPPRSNYFPEGIVPLYSPWLEELGEGSYHFRGGWESIDHFLLSQSLFNSRLWDYAGSELLNSTPFTRADGTPYEYNPRTGRGLSDHLPLLLFLSYSEGN